MLDAIAYINNQGVAHRDLKLDNMLVNSKYQVKISDFSFASEEAIPLGDIRGTPNYMAPEILARTAANGMVADVFSLGVIFFCCITNKYPFNLARPSDKRYKMIMDKDYKAFWESSKIAEGDLTEEAKELAMAMLEHDPEKRIKLADIKKHDWFEAADQLCDEVVDANYLAKKFKLRQQERQAKRASNVEGVRSTAALEFFKENEKAYYIQTLNVPAYEEDGREIELKTDVKLNLLVDQLQKFFEAYRSRNDKKEPRKCNLQTNSYNGKISGFNFTDAGKGFECDINFVHYKTEDESEKTILLQFILKRGLAWSLYKLLGKARHALNLADMCFDD
jgi:serine/threonine protein kinase